MAKAITPEQLSDCLDRVALYFLLTNDDMAGATADTAGAKGMVPAPAAGDNGKFLRGDGTWVPLGAAVTVNHYVDVYNETTGQYDLSVPSVSV